MIFRFYPNDKGSTPGKLADVEIHFEEGDSLPGLKLVGFAIWEARQGPGLNVTFPARQYTVNGERRSFALLRPVAGADATNKLQALMLEGWKTFQQHAHAAQVSTDADVKAVMK